MASPVKFLIMLLISCVCGWIFFMFAARLVAWILSRMLGASVGFRVAGCNILRDFNMRFKKGALDSLYVGEIKLSLRKSLVKLGFSFVSRDPKVHLLISDLEVVLRPSGPKVKKVRSCRRQKLHSAGSRGKWIVVVNLARFFSISVTDLVVKVSKTIIEVKDLKVDIAKDDSSTPSSFVKLKLLPILVHICELHATYDPLANISREENIPFGRAFLSVTEKASAPCICEELLLSSEFGYDEEVGVLVKNVDIACGEVAVGLNAEWLQNNRKDRVERINLDFVRVKKSPPKMWLESIKKKIVQFPEKVSFSVPKLDVKILYHAYDLSLESNVMGIQLRSCKSHAFEESGEATSHFDVQMDFSEIHLLKENCNSVLQILKLAVVSSVDVPLQLAAPVRAEIDIKLGGTQCNVIMSRLKPWMRLLMANKPKMVLHEDAGKLKFVDTFEQTYGIDAKTIMWACTMSAPEMSIVLHSINGSPLYHVCSQSSHLFTNNIASKGIQVHAELGELHLHMADDYQECVMDNLFGVETNSGSLMHIARVSLDWGQKEMELNDRKNDLSGQRLAFTVDITGMGVFFNFQRVESLISTIISFKALFKSLFPSRKTSTHNTTAGHTVKSVRGSYILKFNLERCSVNFFGDASVHNAVVADPKKVNFGSQGGQVVFDASADGTPRTANILWTASEKIHSLNYSTSLDIFHFSVSFNKDKHSTQMDVERARCIYQEYFEESKAGVKVTLFELLNAKYIRKTGGHNEIAVCSLFSATDISVRWEPDPHLSLHGLVLRLKSFAQNPKFCSGFIDDFKGVEPERETDLCTMQSDVQHKKKESVFAIDVEMLKISAGLADGVEAIIQVQSIFSENAGIGVLLEGFMLSLNTARVLQSSRMQISRIPNAPPPNSTFNIKMPSDTTWDWVIRGLDVYICMPYRLQLRAIEDAVEDTLRGLKLIMAANITTFYSKKKENSKKSKEKFSKLGTIRFCIRKLTAVIEDEPLQGWLDEHYRLIKSVVCESDVRLEFLSKIIREGVNGNAGVDQNISERKVCYEGMEIDMHDKLAIQKLGEEIHKKAFRSYYDACQRLAPSEGFGACRTGFQAGFKPSVTRASLLSVCATELDLTLKQIDHGEDGMIDFLKKQDPVCAQHDIPFSRLLGKNIILITSSLDIQIRDYTFPIFSAVGGKCEGCIVLAQQATSFQPQIEQDVFVGKWWKVRMLRSVSGTTPALKTYSDLPIFFQKAEIAFGVGYEPALADISYAFTVALRRATLGCRGDPSNLTAINQPRKEKSLPWWDDMRYYIHGKIGLSINQTAWSLLATTNPYEKLDKAQIISGHMDIHQSDGRMILSAKDFRIFISSLASLMKGCTLKVPVDTSLPFLETPAFSVEVTMDWECDSGSPLDHYLHSLPREGQPRLKVWDPFRSTSLALRFNFTLQPLMSSRTKHDSEPCVLDGSSTYCSGLEQFTDLPTLRVGAHDLAWIFKWWSIFYIPPHKLRSFSRCPRFGVPRISRSGNLSLDKVLTEFFLRVDSMPACIKHMPLGKDDPACGLTFKTSKLKYELCYSRGRQKWTFDCRRDPLDLVYQGFDLHMLTGFVSKEKAKCAVGDRQISRRSSLALADSVSSEKCTYSGGTDDGFLLSSVFFTIRKQAPKADPSRLLPWQEAGKRTLETTYVRSEFENGSESDHTRSDPSDDDGFNVVIADNCLRVFVYELKLLWTLKNRDAVWAWVGGVSKAFEPPRPSPSRQYAQRKLLEEVEVRREVQAIHGNNIKLSSSRTPEMSSQCLVTEESLPSLSSSVKPESSSGPFMVKPENIDNSEEEGTRHFMVNVVQPQFNLHSEDANGRFLLAAANGRILARSFHAVLDVCHEMIKKALYTEGIQIPESEPEMTWKRVELSVMLEHVQAHVAPTDVDPGAGLQWLPKILRSSPKVKRTGALLERVFMPCTMYFRYTRHKGGTAELKVKPLKELTFNSPDITASMTSRQFQVMIDILTNLLFARLPKPRKSSLSYTSDDDDEDDVKEEADEVVPDGVEDVELARIDLEKAERERKLLLDDIRTLLACISNSADSSLSPDRDSNFWMIHSEISILVQQLRKELICKHRSRKDASALLRTALQKAAQSRLTEKEKNKSPSCAMRISLRINKVVWGMLADGKPFAEAEISNMIYDFDRDYKDVGVVQFTTKFFVVRNCLPNSKCDMLLSAWNPPPDWGKKVMLRVDAKQGAPKEGSSPLELFQVDIYPLKIHLTEIMYRMMWEYFFPEEEQDSQRRQEIWKVSTTAGLRAGLRRVRKIAATAEAPASSSRSVKEYDAQPRVARSAVNGVGQLAHVDGSQASMLQNLKANIVCGSASELRRTSSFDGTWEENVAETVANELLLSTVSPESSPFNPTPECQLLSLEEVTRNKLKDKCMKSGRTSHEEKRGVKTQEEKKVRARKMMEFHNIKISQVELLVTYEGSRFAVSDLRLLMDTFHRVEFTGTWRRLFSRVKKHIIWGVLKSVTGMQGKKFKDKTHGHKEVGVPSVPDSDLNFSDSDGSQLGRPDQVPISFLKRPSDGAGDGFVTSIRGLFNSQRRKAKAFVRRTMRGDPENEFHGEWNGSDTEYSTFARQLTITKAKRLLRKHTKKFRSRGQKGVTSQRESLASSPRERSPYQSDSSRETSPYEDL